MALRALEHQVFEEMRDAGLAERIIRRSVPVPDHVGYDRRAAVRDHHHVETVVEGEGRHLRPPTFRTPERGALGAKAGSGVTV
jgi:hypothetical protein